MKYNVLIVDDVVFSQDVLKHYITSYEMSKIKVDCVTNGQQAVDIIKKAAPIYDAVFIDQMMPDMDGTQTARAIREIGTKYAVELPLIAITANETIGDKSTFLIKGFQDFISKPIDTSKLNTIVQRWLITDDRATIKNEEEEVEFLHSFINNTPKLIELARNINQNNLSDYIINIHGIRGSCLNVKANDLANKANELEKAAKSNDLDYILKNNISFLESVEEFIAKAKSTVN
jgi:CheY-like chemotaxis protein